MKTTTKKLLSAIFIIIGIAVTPLANAYATRASIALSKDKAKRNKLNKLKKWRA